MSLNLRKLKWRFFVKKIKKQIETILKEIDSKHRFHLETWPYIVAVYPKATKKKEKTFLPGEYIFAFWH